MTTCGGQHHLLTIYRSGPSMEENVVRWCKRCGAVVVDVDVDGRTAPGSFMPMQLPETETKRQGVQREQV
jgi:hypothetical protein